MIGCIRLWYSGSGRLQEYPNAELKKGDEGTPIGAESYLDLKLDDVGANNDLVGLADNLAGSPRFIDASVRFMIEDHSLRKRLQGSRYRKGAMILTRSDTYNHTLWWRVPSELLAEMDALNKGMDDGWHEEPIFVRHHEGDVVPTTAVTQVYVLKERPVVDMMAVVREAVRMRVATAAVAGVTIGLVLSHILR